MKAGVTLNTNPVFSRCNDLFQIFLCFASIFPLLVMSFFGTCGGYNLGELLVEGLFDEFNSCLVAVFHS